MGTRLYYRSEPDVRDELQRLVEAERVCCGGSGITWDLVHDGGHHVVEVRVPETLRDSAEVRAIGEVLTGTTPPARTPEVTRPERG